MAWYSIPASIAFYLLMPVVAIFNFISLLLAPVTHTASYALHVLFLPVSFLGKFETLYVFFGVAALIGVFTGTFLHLTSSVLITAFNLRPLPEDSQTPKRTAKSVRAARESRQLDEAWASSLLARSREVNDFREKEAKDRMEAALSGQLSYDELARNNGRGLLGTTILEEEDDSGSGF